MGKGEEEDLYKIFKSNVFDLAMYLIKNVYFGLNPALPRFTQMCNVYLAIDSGG